jgi:hypothetical protein
MKKTILMVVMTLFVAIAANAQYHRNSFYSASDRSDATTPFLKDKVYVGASLTGLNLAYNGTSDLNLGLNAQGGYFIMDNIMVLGNIGYSHVGGDDPTPDVFSLGVGGRYYIEQNGIFLGLGAKYKHANHNYNDVMPAVEVGYSFFLNRTVTIEPAIYYEQSFTNHSKYSNVGLRVGFGIYFER